MSRRTDEAQGLRHISWFGAALFRVFGPADLPNGPLKGTRYDPLYRQQRRRELVRVRQAKLA
jgi:hypothetical protein